MTDQSFWNRLIVSLSENPNNWGAGLGTAAQAVNPTGISGQLGGVSGMLHQGAIMEKKQKEAEAKRMRLLQALLGGGDLSGGGGGVDIGMGDGVNAVPAANDGPSPAQMGQIIPTNSNQTMTAPGGAATTAPFPQGSTDPLRAVLLASLLGGDSGGGTSMVGLSPEQIAAIGREERGALGESLSIAAMLGQSDRQIAQDRAAAELAPLERQRLQAQADLTGEKALKAQMEREYLESPDYAEFQRQEQALKVQDMKLKKREQELKASGQKVELSRLEGQRSKLDYDKKNLERLKETMARADAEGLTVNVEGQNVPLSTLMAHPSLINLRDIPSDKQKQIEAIARVRGLSVDDAWAEFGRKSAEDMTFELVKSVLANPLASRTLGDQTPAGFAEGVVGDVRRPADDDRVTREFLDGIRRGVR